jgi:hypothetical protein
MPTNALGFMNAILTHSDHRHARNTRNTEHIRLLRLELRSPGLFKQPVLLISYRRFGTTYRSHLQGSRTTDP